MTQTTAITDAITTLTEAERRFNLRRSQAKSFFTEWQPALPELTAVEQTALDDLRQRYLYHRSDGDLGSIGFAMLM